MIAAETPASPLERLNEVTHQLVNTCADLHRAEQRSRSEVESALAERDKWEQAYNEAIMSQPVISKAAQDILNERQRQIEAEGFTAERDARYVGYPLARAGAAYALAASATVEERDGMLASWVRAVPNEVVEAWPSDWDARHFKPKTRRDDLVKAAALILAQLDQMDRNDEDPGLVEG